MTEIKNNSQSPKKYVVLTLLFVLPIVAYLFFSSGVDNFLKLPTLHSNVKSLNDFKNLQGDQVTFDNRITLAVFFGEKPLQMQGNAINLNEKIYDRYHEFKDFQILIFITPSAIDDAKELLAKLGTYSNTADYKFAVGSIESIESVFKSLDSPYILNSNTATDYVFIIDKEKTLRGRTDDDDTEDGLLYAYNSANIAEVADKLNDDVKVLLAEYRLALKKNNLDSE